MSRPATLLAVGLLLVVGSAAVAQPADQGPPRQRFFGMGGSGGSGSLADLWAPLLRAEQVRKELELAPEQVEKLKEIGEKATGRVKEALSGMQSLREASAEQRKAKIAEVTKKARALSEELRKDIEAILLPHQIERLKQIACQVRGLAALEDSGVQAELKLTDEQKSQLKSLRDSIGEKLRGAGRPASDEDRRALREKFEAARKQAEEKVLALLTPEQKEKFEKMKGAKLDLDMSQLFRREPGRGDR